MFVLQGVRYHLKVENFIWIQCDLCILQVENFTWIQCDNVNCQKWRKIQTSEEECYDDVDWFCYMNTDPHYNRWGGMLPWCGLVLLHEHRPSLQQTIYVLVYRHSLNSYSTLTSVMHLQFCYEDVCQLIPGLTQWFLFYPLVQVLVPIQLGKMASKSNKLGFFISVHVMSNW